MEEYIFTVYTISLCIVGFHFTQNWNEFQISIEKSHAKKHNVKLTKEKTKTRAIVGMAIISTVPILNSFMAVLSCLDMIAKVTMKTKNK